MKAISSFSNYAIFQADESSECTDLSNPRPDLYLQMQIKIQEIQEVGDIK